MEDDGVADDTKAQAAAFFDVALGESAPPRAASPAQTRTNGGGYEPQQQQQQLQPHPEQTLNDGGVSQLVGGGSGTGAEGLGAALLEVDGGEGDEGGEGVGVMVSGGGGGDAGDAASAASTSNTVQAWMFGDGTE